MIVRGKWYVKNQLRTSKNRPTDRKKPDVGQPDRSVTNPIFPALVETPLQEHGLANIRDVHIN
jgi:hypothetical protein